MMKKKVNLNNKYNNKINNYKILIKINKQKKFNLMHNYNRQTIARY